GATGSHPLSPNRLDNSIGKHLDEVFITINGELKYLWRAVDADGNAPRHPRPEPAGHGRGQALLPSAPQRNRGRAEVIVTDKLRSYRAAHREVMPSVEHRSHKGLNNRAENSHQPTRQRERAMKGFRSVGAAQRFLAAFSGISPHFRPRRHLMTVPDHRAEMTIRFAIWDQATGATGRPAEA
ncbi:transposase, partial [Streptomyces sp. NPDC058770]|uniref:transposase n=1 Tax=Streptomyces sp. NPDC058770 TaxID=3346631 RepID=UPI0036786F39